MTEPLNVRDMVASAEAEIETLSVAEAMQLHGRDDVVFVDIRDVRELWREGRVTGSEHCPRGMLEFWVDRDSPYAKELFGRADTRFVFYCQSGWRSALATQTVQAMGLTPVCHIEPGLIPGAPKATDSPSPQPVTRRSAPGRRCWTTTWRPEAACPNASRRC